MIRYYKHWKTTTDDPKILKYCDKMIEHFSNEDRPDGFLTAMVLCAFFWFIGYLKGYEDGKK